MIQLLKDKVALVASASETVTHRVAHLFLQHGASVMTAGHHPSFPEQEAEFRDATRWQEVQADFGLPSGVRRGVEEALKRFNGIDVVFYHPGLSDEPSATDGNAVAAYLRDVWASLVANHPRLSNAPTGQLIVVSEVPSDTELVHVGDLKTADHQTSIDLINAIQTYQPKRQQSLTAQKQLTPERIARLALSILLKGKDDEVEWNEVMSWTSEYLYPS
ncbi:MAG: hypothetical protein WA958_17745 [Tunicatimonas sp.]